MTFDEWFEKTKTQEPYCWQGLTYEDIWEAGQKAEREACASVCEKADFKDYWTDDDDYDGGMLKGADVCAKAIRERGEQE